MKMDVMSISSFFSWVIWFFLICLWNYGFPEAKPIEDVIASVLLGYVLLFLKILFKKKN